MTRELTANPSRSGRVLIIAPADDLHAKAVQHWVHREGGEAFILDFARYPAEIDLSSFSHIPPESEVRWGSHRYQCADLSGLWLRRYRAARREVPQQTGGGSHPFAGRERIAAFEGWVELAEAAGVHVVNRPDRERRAANKLALPRACAALGIPTPQTLSTNSPDVAAAFVRHTEIRGAGVVYKAHTATDVLIPTRRWTRADRDALGMLRNAPVMFQEYLPGPNLRVTVIRDEVFIAEVRSELPNTECDWRQEVFNETVPMQNEAVQQQAKAICRYYGLAYCALDFRGDSRGNFCLIDVNPGGQFLFVEIRTGYPIARAVARALMA